MDEVHELDRALAARLEQAHERIADAYRNRDVDRSPVVVLDVPSGNITGVEPELIPDDYFADGAFASMLGLQTQRIEAHLKSLPDDYIPVLFPWYGTDVVTSALGGTVLFPPKSEPVLMESVIRDPQEVKRLLPPDPERDGLMPRVLRCIDYMHAHSNYPVTFTDCQGPFSIAVSLCGVDTFCLWMYDYPTIAHELMDFCTEVLINWVKVQKSHAGQELESGAFPEGVIVPGGFGGVGLSDDDCTIISPALYREFVMPYNSRVYLAFGGGTLHYCGNAGHQIENFRDTRGLTGLNVWCMGDFGHVRQLQQGLQGRMAITVCDYTPLNIEPYFAQLLACLDPRGSIIGTFPAAQEALKDGHVFPAARRPADIGQEAWQAIQRLSGMRN
jgi:uroporphyrinogen-III decarboxylase